MITEQQVWDKLKTVKDPELGINVVDLGLIYEVRIQETEDSLSAQADSQNDDKKYKVFILMTLTSPGCPLAGMFDDLVGGVIRQMAEVSECNIEITFDPPWDMGKMSEEARAELGIF